ncbi:OsmC-like protein [Afipia felis]|uniref:OsmC-like protein n=1 Tax=Afipia felis TaxID=1035 RepID=A0A090MQH2_AFIFE|nr:OsmC family protein [Afipia felis]CEG09640.1 OsmC-like protein [Afipia felis]
MNETHSVTITRQDKFKFLINFEPGLGQIMGDETPPIGDGTGPASTHLLTAAMTNCLSASLVFAIGKFKGDPGHLVTTATWEVDRNEQNRLHITGVNVAITLGVAADTLPRLDRALEQFEDFCAVSQSVRAGIPFNVTVKEVDGTVLKQG